MKGNFSEPKIYSGGINPNKWSSLTKTEQKETLQKDWYVYYSFRDPLTGHLKRQPNIKAGANKFKNKRERIDFLKTLQRNLVLLLEAGFDPHKDNSELEKVFFKTKTIPVPPIIKEDLHGTNVHNEGGDYPKINIKEGFDLALKTKQIVLNNNTYSKFKSHINRFLNWLERKAMTEKPIDSITKKTIVLYLNSVLQATSARNRNNARTNLSSLFQTLEDNEIITENFVKKINILNSTPTRNKTYTPQLQKDIDQYLKENDPLMLLFVQFISYNYLRPIEVCRLQLKDIDLLDKKIYVRAKNRPVKIKIIPEILINELPDLSIYPNDHFLFTPKGIGGIWAVSETDKRNYFSKRFKKVKDHFNLGKEYGLYSFRHTFITILYRELAKQSSPFETKSKLMLITGHTSMIALDKYLRDIDAALPEDYSQLLYNSNK